MFDLRWMRAAALACLTTASPGGNASALDFATVARQVVAANPRLAARRSMVEAARYRVGPAGAWESPMVELGVENVPTSGRFDMDPMTMKVIGVSQRIPVFGRTGLARRSAEAAAEAEAAGSRMTRFEILGLALEAYADAYHAGVLSGYAANHQEAMARLVRSARSRYESGSGRLEDILRSESERARTLADLAGFRAEEGAARARLDAIRGVTARGSKDTLAPPPLLGLPDREIWLAAISPGHPRLRENEAQVRRYRWAARAARRTTWPDLELRGTYQKREPLADGTEQDDMWSAMVGIMVPIFAGSRELAEGAEMDAMARASEAELRDAELELKAQVTAAHAQAVAAQREVALLVDTVLTTQSRAVEATWASYTAGTTDLWRVLEATHALYGEEVALVRVRQELAQAAARLLSLTGRGDLIGIALPDERNEP